MGKLKRTLKISSIAVAALAGAAVLALSLPTFGRKSFSVQSGSMVPAINKGSVVNVKSVPAGELAVGDVVTFVNPSNQKTTITHRIIQIMGQEDGPKQFITKGDANLSADAPIDESAVIGRVERNIPYLGYVVDSIRQPLGLILIIYVPALIIIAHEMKRLVAYYRQITPYSLRPKKRSTGHAPIFILAGVLVIAAVVGIAKPTFAAFLAQASLTGNTITMTTVPPEPPPSESTCNNNNNVNINGSTNQTSQSGSAESSGNTNGGSATSGNASNSSSTSVNVNINNTCAQP